MKNITKLLSAVAAGLVLSTGAYAQEAAQVSNLGPAVVGASQSEGGLFGNMGENGFGVAVVGGMTLAFFLAANAWEDEEEVVVPAPVPTPTPTPPAHH